MGIIIKQSIKGSIWSYLGVILGFVTTSYLYPQYLTTDTVGLFGLLISWSGLFSVFAALGFTGATARLFPYFRDREKGHNGYLFLIFIFYILGSLLFLAVFYWMRPWLISSNLEKSALFSEYVDWLIPLTLFALLFLQLDIYIKVLYDAVYGIFAKEFVQRLLILIVTLLFVFQIFGLHQLIVAFVAANCFTGVMLVYYLIDRGEFHIKPNLGFVTPKMWRQILDVSSFSILAGVGNRLIFNIDKIIINQIMGLSATGVYTIAFYFGVLVVIPSRTLLRISGTLIADAFRRDDLEYISDIYRRTSLNQFIIGAFLFGGITINIENIITILGPAYADGRWVIILIGFGYLVDMITGANAQIIAYSKHYRMTLYFIAVLIVLVIVNLFIFIPLWGLTGAAFAIGFSIVINNFMRFLYLKRKFDMQPFTPNTLKVTGIFLLALGLSFLIPTLSVIPDLLLRSIIFSLIYGGLILATKVSEDLNDIVRKFLKRV